MSDREALAKIAIEEAADNGTPIGEYTAYDIADAAIAWGFRTFGNLSAELKARDAALTKVELACDAMDAGVAIRSGDPRTKSHAATAIRAAIREALNPT